jgi:putative redox protein
MEILVRSGEGLVQEIDAGRHHLRSDEPVDRGGTDAGPDPYDLLCAALGACTSMTLRLYARHKGWPLEEVKVVVRHDKIHAADCAVCETKEGRLDRIRREISLRGRLDDEQRTRLLEMANKCPVHRTLTSEVQIETLLLPRSGQ